VIGRVEEGAAAPVLAKRPVEKKPEPAAKEETVREPALSPSARVAAESRGIDPAQLTGSGRGGRITKQDVLQHPTDGNGASRERERPEVSSPPVAHAPGSPGSPERETRQGMSATRQRIAARLVDLLRATASLTTFHEVDLSAFIHLLS